MCPPLDSNQRPEKPGQRQCGECQECCTVLEVSEGLVTLDERPIVWRKERGLECEMIGDPGKGCAIYSDRPRACQAWACAWLDGADFLPDDWRPDKLGMIMWKETTAVGPSLCVDECRDGVIKENMEWLLDLSAHIPVLILHPGRARTLIVDGVKKDVLHTPTHIPDGVDFVSAKELHEQATKKRILTEIAKKKLAREAKAREKRERKRAKRGNR